MTVVHFKKSLRGVFDVAISSLKLITGGEALFKHIVHIGNRNTIGHIDYLNRAITNRQAQVR
jgi:hypothetical protein